MNLFSNFFHENEGGNSTNKKPDIDKILAMDDINDGIIELFNYIFELCAWGEELEKITAEQKHFYFNQNMEREVNNGGFDQFFFDSSGDYAHETVESLKAIGANKTAMLLQQAIAQFPNQTVPKNRDERRKILEQIEEKSIEIWEELEHKFYAYEDDLNTLNLAYVKLNKDKF